MSGGEGFDERDVIRYVITSQHFGRPVLFNGVQHVEQSSGGGTLSPFSRELTTTRKPLP
jgi:hypothetical protein